MLFASTWIETFAKDNKGILWDVVLFASTWIETLEQDKAKAEQMVVLFASTWIETDLIVDNVPYELSRALREHVD